MNKHTRYSNAGRPAVNKYRDKIIQTVQMVPDDT